MESKKILIINTTFDRGGAAQVARDLFLKFQGIEGSSLFFAYGKGGVKQEKNTFYFGSKIEFIIHLFLVRFLGLEGCGSYFSTNKLIKYIKREKFDLIHLHNLHGYYLNFFKLLEYLNKQNIKIIWTLHDEWLFTWLPAHSMGCQHCKTLKGKCVNKYKYPRNYLPLFSRLMLKKKREILEYKNINFICPAQWLYEETINELGLQKVSLISNGVDVNVFQPHQNKIALRKKYNLPLDKKLVLFVVNNFRDKNKGGKYFIELAEILKNEPLCFCVIGSSEFPNIESVFKFGYIHEKEQLAEIYSSADLYCFLSAVETAPLSVLEAMSCALPVVGFNIKALKGLIDENNGQLIDYSDINALALAITTCLKNEQLLLDYGQNSRKTVLEKFDQEKNFVLYKNFYTSK
ncbi:MAG: glycosyltransferase [Patescibacteria group bacterium]|nr:glycosyltransferase [Patescibacteria group bacterium]